jgi:hypothetical protein
MYCNSARVRWCLCATSKPHGGTHVQAPLTFLSYKKATYQSCTDYRTLNSFAPRNVCSACYPRQHGDRRGVRAGPCSVQHVEPSLWLTDELRYVRNAIVRGGSIPREPLLLRVPRGVLHLILTQSLGACPKLTHVQGVASTNTGTSGGAH